jgi:hypothetical protein
MASMIENLTHKVSKVGWEALGEASEGVGEDDNAHEMLTAMPWIRAIRCFEKCLFVPFVWSHQ